MAMLWRDLRFGARQLARSPVFTAVAVLTLALGIGANTAMFSAVHAILLRPLPFAQPERLVSVYDVQPEVPKAPASLPKFLDWQAHSQSFEYIAGFRGTNFNLTGEGEPERLRGALVTADFFRVLGVEPALGRGFVKGEDGPGGSRVILLTDGLWRRRFGGEQGVLGRSLLLNGQSYTIVGILPPGFEMGRAEVWANLIPEPRMSSRGLHFLSVLGRLKPEVTLEAARAEMKVLGDQLNQQHGTTHGIRVESYFEEIVGDMRPTLLVLLGAVAFVLLIACANVANLLLARAVARQREIAVRAALGASRWSVMRLVLTEGLLLAVLGGAVGMLLACWGVDWMLSAGADLLPRARTIQIDLRVLGFASGLSLLTVAVFGVLPAWMAARVPLQEALKEGGHAGLAGGRRGKTRAALVVTELALAVILLAGAGLMLHSFARLLAEPLGFQADGLLTMRIALPAASYDSAEKQAEFFRHVLERVQTLPGVEYAAVMNDPPLTQGNTNGNFQVEGRTWPPGDLPLTEFRVCSEGYFRALGIPLKRGRFFTNADAADAPPVVIINETMAKRFWPNQDPIGQRMDPQWGRRLGWREIVGVVGDVKHGGPTTPALAETYIPYRQQPVSDMYLVLRTTSDPLAVAAAVRRQVLAVDKDQPVFEVRTMTELLRRSTAKRQVSTALIGSFAGLAIILAAVGLYGVISYSVNQRRQEIGIRMALGASPRGILRLVVGQALRLAGLGILLGLAAAVAMSRLLATLLFEVSPYDPLTFVGVPILLNAVALLACWIPARRAARVDPNVALRYE